MCPSLNACVKCTAGTNHKRPSNHGDHVSLGGLLLVIDNSCSYRCCCSIDAPSAHHPIPLMDWPRNRDQETHIDIMSLVSAIWEFIGSQCQSVDSGALDGRRWSQILLLVPRDNGLNAFVHTKCPRALPLTLCW